MAKKDKSNKKVDTSQDPSEVSPDTDGTANAQTNEEDKEEEESSTDPREEAKSRAQAWLDKNGPTAPSINDKPYFDPYDQMEDGQEDWAYWEEGGQQFSGEMPESKSELKYNLRLGG